MTLFIKIALIDFNIYETIWILRNESSGNGNGFRLFLLQNSVHSMKCRQTMLHVECRTINHFFRLDKRIKIEITSYSYNFEIVVYSFFDKNIFSFSNKAKLKLKHFSFFVHGFRFLLLCKILFQPRWDVARCWTWKAIWNVSFSLRKFKL